MKIDWKKKLTSRKFWVAVIGFITPLLLAFGVCQDNVTQIAAIIMAGGALIAYILGESSVDASWNNSASDEGDEDTIVKYVVRHYDAVTPAEEKESVTAEDTPKEV